MDAALARPRRESRPESRPGLFEAEPRFAAAAYAFALSLAVTLAAAALDPRLFQGEDIWAKPIKFQLALAIYLATLAAFARWLPAGLTARRGWRVYANVVVACTFAEMAWIAGAAMAGTGSHFNTTIPGLYPLMGIVAITLTTPTLVMGIAIWRNPRAGLAPALRLAIGLGLILTFALTIPIASVLAQAGGHLVGTPVTGAEVPVLGWSREVGDLRAPHFLATHALHAIPLAGLAAVLLLPERRAKPAVWAAAALFTLLVLVALAGALAGQPLIA